MAHVSDNKSEIHQQAVIVLIKRMILSPLMVGDDRTRCLAEVVNTFWDEFPCFATKKKMFCFPYIWEKTQQDAAPAYYWH
jgi:hypothetical protein